MQKGEEIEVLRNCALGIICEIHVLHHVKSGSKRLPHERRAETGPRRVKTYAERLQEMKTGPQYSTPVAPKSQYGSSS